ncbi:hypothetical protein T4D_6917 [Trichinella pseudospiralis]|uniref:Uncharacterized protein n=1 Tax=Trichinella pseudospiralis TaxID=6337 RepID=A0A0V1F3M1_TRIPS|nr:hypothetical protein T4D_6917 [Trichinella pseudospiralis]
MAQRRRRGVEPVMPTDVNFVELWVTTAPYNERYPYSKKMSNSTFCYNLKKVLWGTVIAIILRGEQGRDSKGRRRVEDVAGWRT